MLQNRLINSMEKLQYRHAYEDEDEDGDYYNYCDSEEIKYGMTSKMGDWNWAMNAGKKLVVTGVVISSAPVLLPPLLVVSALGFAMSLPFGIGFAAFACTHKLMTNLLPPPPLTPPLPLPLPYYEEDDEDLDSDPDPDSDYSVEQLDQVKMSEDIRNENQLRIVELVDDVPEETASYDPVINVDTDLEREGDDEDEGEISRSENENNVVIDVEAEGSLQLKQGNGGGDDNKTGGGVVGDGVDVTASRGDEPKIVLKEDKEHKGEPKIVLKGEKENNRGINEEREAEKIWEKINAVRVIVGFKAPRRTSCLEEVKALYLFTGIEPPPPPSSSSDQFAELDAKLNFLMSVIGLK